MTGRLPYTNKDEFGIQVLDGWMDGWMGMWQWIAGYKYHVAFGTDKHGCMMTGTLHGNRKTKFGIEVLDHS